MGIYDNIVFHPDLDLDSDFPFDPYVDSDGDIQLWQTKDLHPSMDMYAVSPCGMIEGKPPYLYRRHPPIYKWTESNEGRIDEFTNIFDGADHWRLVKMTGEVDMSVSIHNDNVIIYECQAVFDMGLLQNIKLVDTKEFDSANVIE